MYQKIVTKLAHNDINVWFLFGVSPDLLHHSSGFVYLACGRKHCTATGTANGIYILLVLIDFHLKPTLP